MFKYLFIFLMILSSAGNAYDFDFPADCWPDNCHQYFHVAGVGADTSQDDYYWGSGNMLSAGDCTTEYPIIYVPGFGNDETWLDDYVINAVKDCGAKIYIVPDTDECYTELCVAETIHDWLDYNTRYFWRPLYGVEKVHIIAHSFGGLGSRVLVSSNGLNDNRVASIVTLSSPHRGGHSLVQWMIGLGIEHMADFNEDYPEGHPDVVDVNGVDHINGVMYHSFGASINSCQSGDDWYSGCTTYMCLYLAPEFEINRDIESGYPGTHNGANDGRVADWSARGWGLDRGMLNAGGMGVTHHSYKGQKHLSGCHPPYRRGVYDDTQFDARSLFQHIAKDFKIAEMYGYYDID